MNVIQKQYDITECDREPIHHIAAIQPIGGLMALNGDLVVAHSSRNCAEMLGIEQDLEVGSKLSDILTPRAIDQIRSAIRRLPAPDAVERLFGLRMTQGGGLFDLAVHASNAKIVIEFEPHAEDEYADHLALIGPVISQLEPLRDVKTLCDRAAVLVREMLGYDRVMVYRFHRDESGEVVSEARRDDLEPYLGLRYPRADIPQQARELFVRNRFRIIADMSAPSVPIEPAISFDGKPLDLSMSVLRSHSQMHVKYMQNMGVEASLAIAIVRQGRLWGMISCHHYAPKVPPYSLRTVAEMFSQMFSLMLDRALVDEAETMRAKGRKLHDRLMLSFAEGTDFAESLPMLDIVLRDVIPHDGASVLFNGDYYARGDAPDEAQFFKLLPKLGSAPVSQIIASDELATYMPEASAFSDVAAGGLFLPISRSPRDYLILWRKPIAQTVTWAGDPKKAIAAAGERLEPRGSFAAWEQTVEGRSTEWTDDELQIAEGLRVTLLEVILRMTDEAARERARAQEQQELLIAELNHRVRNILNLIRSLVSQSQHDAESVVDFSRIIGGRISALASAHDNITRENWAPAPLTSLIKTEAEAYLTEKKDRLQISGDEVLVKPEAYTVLALVIHELVTNSAKYGSLCDRHGTLAIDLSRNRTGDLVIAWRERGGPPVKPPSRRGFGSTIIERSIPYELKGEAELRFKLAGLEADFIIPERFIIEGAPSLRTEVQGTEKATPEGADQAAGAGRSETQADALPGHVLIVEDSMIIALDTEETVRRLGVGSVAIAASVPAALEAIEQRRPDYAIVDFNLGDHSSAPVTAALREADVPFVLATGYAEMADEIDEIGARALLRKPYGRSDIEELFSVRVS